MIAAAGGGGGRSMAVEGGWGGWGVMFPIPEKADAAVASPQPTDSWKDER